MRQFASPAEDREYEFVNVAREDRVGIVTLHRPRAMNALTAAMGRDVADSVEDMDKDKGVGCVVVTGGTSVFAAGGEVGEEQKEDGEWINRIATVSKPIVAAVEGYALGIGCELVMACDVVICGESARFGQPEIRLGLVPGWGGSQRLVRAVGKAKAMEMLLTGRRMTADEAESAGLVTRVADKGEALEEAMDVAKIIAGMSMPVAKAAKKAINYAFESTLSEGLSFEQKCYKDMFKLEDYKEGVKAFLDKRDPKWNHR